jgi:hypothetical protein
MTDEASEPPAATPRPFILTFTAPAGLPWDQQRLIRLEASHAAPLPADQIVLDLRRLDPWRLGRESRFAGAYFRRQDVRGEIRHTEEIDGREVQFVGQDAEAAARARWARLAPPAAGAIAVILFGALAALAVMDRAERDVALEDQARIVRRDLTVAEQTQRRLAEAQALDQAGARGARLSDALADLVWLSRARDPNAAVSAVGWRPEAMVVEAAGAAVPIATHDRTATRVPAPGAGSRWRIAPPPGRRPDGASPAP